MQSLRVPSGTVHRESRVLRTPGSYVAVSLDDVAVLPGSYAGDVTAAFAALFAELLHTEEVQLLLLFEV